MQATQVNRNIVVRIVLTLLALPLIVLVSIWDYQNYLPMAFLVVVFSAFGAVETALLLKTKGFVVNPYLPAPLGILFPVLGYCENLGWIHSDNTMTIVALVIVVILVRQIFANTEKNLEPVLGKVTGILFTLVYPGFFLYFLVKILTFANIGPVMALFCMATFGNDAMAWIFGTLWGKRSRKPFLVSPTKSLIGFLGGILGTIIIFVVFQLLFPGILGHQWGLILPAAVVLAFTTIIGDLFESSLKRSAGVKDSGSMIPGRGGVLDSIDSLLFSAPVFYVFLLFGRI